MPNLGGGVRYSMGLAEGCFPLAALSASDVRCLLEQTELAGYASRLYSLPITGADLALAERSDLHAAGIEDEAHQTALLECVRVLLEQGVPREKIGRSLAPTPSRQCPRLASSPVTTHPDALRREIAVSRTARESISLSLHPGFRSPQPPPIAAATFDAPARTSQPHLSASELLQRGRGGIYTVKPPPDFKALHASAPCSGTTRAATLREEHRKELAAMQARAQAQAEEASRMRAAKQREMSQQVACALGESNFLFERSGVDLAEAKRREERAGEARRRARDAREKIAMQQRVAQRPMLLLGGGKRQHAWKEVGGSRGAGDESAVQLSDEGGEASCAAEGSPALGRMGKSEGGLSLGCSEENACTREEGDGAEAEEGGDRKFERGGGREENEREASMRGDVARLQNEVARLQNEVAKLTTKLEEQNRSSDGFKNERISSALKSVLAGCMMCPGGRDSVLAYLREGPLLHVIASEVPVMRDEKIGETAD